MVHHGAWWSWLQATALASMAGGVADWFAVTALFRRPLGLPIPHTAIVVERKDRFAETLGAFVQESFLSPDSVAERLHATGAVERLAGWMANPENADVVAERVAGAVTGTADLLRDDDIHEILDTLVRSRIDEVALAPLAGRALGELTREGRHQPSVDVALATLGRQLSERAPDLHRRIGERSPWWLPGPLEQRIVGRLIERSQEVLGHMAADRDHPLRRQLDESLVSLARDLQSSPELRKRGEELKAELAGRQEVRAFVTALWTDAKNQLREQAADPRSDLRRRLAAFVASTGLRLGDDPQLAAAASRALDTAARSLLERFDTELVGLVSGTVAKWDAGETSRRLELLLGPDLQYIRINGTVVGALAGVALHAVSQLLP